MIDLDDLEQRCVKGWGDRMTVGVQVLLLKALIEEARANRERLRLYKAQLDALEVQADFWQRACERLTDELKRRLTHAEVAAYGERMYAEGQADELGDGKADPPPEPDESERE